MDIIIKTNMNSDILLQTAAIYFLSNLEQKPVLQNEKFLPIAGLELTTLEL